MDAVVITLSGGPFREVKFEGGSVTAGAGAELAELISDCCERGLSGLEGLVGVPATVGGAIMTNAGYLSTISDRLVRVDCLDNSGNVISIDKGDIDFGYRRCSLGKDWIVVGAVFCLEEGTSPRVLKEKVKEYFLDKMSRQPLEKKTLGCVFKNPGNDSRKSAELIDMAGMKGERSGGAEVSGKHANFIVNTGDANAADMVCLVEEVKRKVMEKFSIELEPEIEIL
jgi:UDP-N-acetylmuramate dehydrogenase